MRGGPLRHFAIVAVLLSVNTGAALGAGFSFTGTFLGDDQTQIFSFQAAATSVVIRTLGYAGGTNNAGTHISAGGFDPVLSLFGPDGTLIATTPLLKVSNDGAGGPNCSVTADPASGAAFDACIDTANAPTVVALVPGQTYFVVLTQSDNLPLGGTFGAGFSEVGQGNFTTNFGCGPGPFRDVTCTAVRNGNWAVDISGVTTAQGLGGSGPGGISANIPTLTEWGMILMACGLIFVAARRLRPVA